MTVLVEGTIPSTRQIIFQTGDIGTDFRTDVLDFDRVNIDKITLFNNIQTQQTIILYCTKKFGTFRKLRQFKLKIDESAEYLLAGEFVPLDNGDSINAETTTDDAVDFTIFGRLS